MQNINININMKKGVGYTLYTNVTSIGNMLFLFHVTPFLILGSLGMLSHFTYPLIFNVVST